MREPRGTTTSQILDVLLSPLMRIRRYEGEGRRMIHLTRINHAPLVLNSDLIEHIEATPDTVITLTNAQKMMVLESADEVIQRVIEFRQRVLNSVLPAREAGL